MDLKVGDCIKYNFLYSNEEEKIGLITQIKEDYNFSFMVYVIDNNCKVDIIPYSIMEYHKL